MEDSKNVCSRYKEEGLTSSGISLLPTPYPIDAFSVFPPAWFIKGETTVGLG